MLTITLLDFSSGDITVTHTDGTEESCTERTLLPILERYKDKEPAELKRSYSPGKHNTDVGDIRSEHSQKWGLWGW